MNRCLPALSKIQSLMKYAIAIACLALVVFLFSSCKTKQYTMEENPEPMITFGSGGGFTGQSTFYTLFKNGQLYKKKGLRGEHTPLENVKKKEVLQIFKNYEVLNLAEVNINEPGNMSYFIEFKDENGVHRMTWGGNTTSPSNDLLLFYKLLMNTTKPSTDKSKS